MKPFRFAPTLVATLVLGAAVAHAQPATAPATVPEKGPAPAPAAAPAPAPVPSTAPPIPLYWPPAAMPLSVPAQGQPLRTAPAGRIAIQSSTEAEPPAYSWKPIRFTIAIDGQTAWMLPSTTQTAWGRKAQSGGGLSAQYEFLRYGTRDALAAELSILSQDGQRSLADGSSAKASDFRAALGVVYSHDVTAWLAPYVRAAAGGGSMKLTVDDGNRELSDKRRFLEGRLGAGVALRSPSLRMGKSADSFALAGVFRVEGGYLLGNSQSFSVQRNTTSGVENPIPVAAIDVGNAPHRAPYLRFSFGVGF